MYIVTRSTFANYFLDYLGIHILTIIGICSENLSNVEVRNLLYANTDCKKIVCWVEPSILKIIVKNPLKTCI